MEEPTRYLRRCPRCGAAVSPRAKFCSECGLALSAVSPGELSGPDEDETVLLGSRRGTLARGVGSRGPTRVILHDANSAHDIPFGYDEATRVLPREEGAGENGSREVREGPADEPGDATHVMGQRNVRDSSVRDERASNFGAPVSRDGETRVSYLHDDRDARPHGRVAPVEDTSGEWKSVPPQGGAGEAFTWKARAGLRRFMDKLVGSDIREAKSAPVPKERLTPRLRHSEWPQRLAMPKLAALVGGALCLALNCGPWLSATAVQSSGGLSSIATLAPWGIVRNSWELVSAAWRGTGASSQTLTDLGISMVASGDAASFSALVSLALLVLGILRLVALVLLALGLVSALVGESPYRFSALRRGIAGTFWSAIAWVVVLPRFGWGVTHVATSSPSRGIALANLIMSYPSGRGAWIALIVSLVTLLVLRVWRQSHRVYPWE